MKPAVMLLFICLAVSMKGQKVHTTSGKVVRIENFQSEFIQPRNVDVWLPEDYNPQNEYAVLYMHDGQMLFDSTSTWNKQEWQVVITSYSIHYTKLYDRISKSAWVKNFRSSIIVGQMCR